MLSVVIAFISLIIYAIATTNLDADALPHARKGCEALDMPASLIFDDPAGYARQEKRAQHELKTAAEYSDRYKPLWQAYKSVDEAIASGDDDPHDISVYNDQTARLCASLTGVQIGSGS
jgi:hypothetical protein